jgi:hypothetical protein
MPRPARAPRTNAADVEKQKQMARGQNEEVEKLKEQNQQLIAQLAKLKPSQPITTGAKFKMVDGKKKYFDHDPNWKERLAKMTEDKKKNKMKDITKMSKPQLGKIVWNDVSFQFYEGFDKATRKVDDKTIVHVDKVDATIKVEYENLPPNIGRDTFFGIIARKYVGISRRKIDAFLKLQPVYQMAQVRVKKSMAKSIISTRPFQRIQIDTISTKNFSDGKYPHTLTLIDTFSKFSYAEPLKDHTAKTCSIAFGKVLKRMTHPPKVVQSDNGTEFADLDDDFPNLKFIKSSAWLPQANGMIERVHRFIKSYVHFAQENKKLPYPEQLQRVIKLFNERKHSITNLTPTDVNTKELPQKTKDYIHERIKRGARKHNPNDGVFEKLEKGDFVRIAIMKKSQIDHQYQYWSNDVFVISMARKNDTYKISDQDGEVLKYIYQRDYLKKIPEESGKQIVAEQKRRTADEKAMAIAKRREQDDARQEEKQAKQVNEATKRAEFKFAQGQKLRFPKEFFSEYDRSLYKRNQYDEKIIERTGVVVSKKKKLTVVVKGKPVVVEKGYTIRFISDDYAEAEKARKKNPKLNPPFPYDAKEVEKYATPSA